MDQYIPQEEVRGILISDMVKKRNSIVLNSNLTSMKDRSHYELVLLPLYSFSSSLVLLWLSYSTLKWISGVFEKDSKVEVRKYMPLTDLLLK